MKDLHLEHVHDMLRQAGCTCHVTHTIPPPHPFARLVSKTVSDDEKKQKSKSSEY